MNRRAFIAAMAGAGLAGLVGCTTTRTSGSASTSDGLTIGLTYIPDVQFSLFYRAVDAGYFGDVDVTLRHHGSNESLFGALTSGQEQVVFAGGDEMMQARSQGTDVVDFATMFRRHPACLIVPDDSPIATAADLRGASVGVPGPFGENWFFLLALLKQANLTQSDITVMNIGYTQQAAITGGRCDAVVGFVNNEVVQLRDAGVKVRTIELDSNALVGAGLGASSATISQRADALVTVVAGLRRALSDITADPQVAIEASKSRVASVRSADGAKAALATLTATLPLFGTPATAGEQDGTAWEAMAAMMLDSGLLAKEVPASEAYTTAIVSG